MQFQSLGCGSGGHLGADINLRMVSCLQLLGIVGSQTAIAVMIIFDLPAVDNRGDVVRLPCRYALIALPVLHASLQEGNFLALAAH